MKTWEQIEQEYIEGQFKKVSNEYKEYKPKLKIIKPNGETNWIDITETDLIKIKNILTKKVR